MPHAIPVIVRRLRTGFLPSAAQASLKISRSISHLPQTEELRWDRRRRGDFPGTALTRLESLRGVLLKRRRASNLLTGQRERAASETDFPTCRNRTRRSGLLRRSV